MPVTGVDGGGGGWGGGWGGVGGGRAAVCKGMLWSGILICFSEYPIITGSTEASEYWGRGGEGLTDISIGRYDVMLPLKMYKANFLPY